MPSVSLSALGWIGTAATLAGAGVSYFATQNAARAQQSIAIANAQAQGDAARAQAQQQQMALKFQKLQQDGVAQASSLQAQALLKSSEAATNAAQQNIRRQREQFEALVAQQYAALGQAGVSPTTGSPIDLLMENAAAEQEQEMLMRDEDEERRRAAIREAQAIQSQGFSAGINSKLLSLESSAAGMRGRMGVAQSRLDAASATAAARGTSGQALGNLLSAGSGAAFQQYQFRRDFKTVNKSIS
jgi:hypothetical protein